jgi:hypothetical protein
MFYYGVKSWGNQELLFIYRSKTINNLSGQICYVKKAYKIYKTKPHQKGPKINSNLAILYKLIDVHEWGNLIFMTLYTLPLESDKFLYVNCLKL